MNRKTLLLILLLFVLAWSLRSENFTLKLTPISFSPRLLRTDVKPIEVHPEVYNLQESFARVAETVKPAVVSISTIHLEKFAGNPYEFFFMDPDDLFEHFFNSPHVRPPSQGSPQERKKQYQRKIPGTGSGVIIDPDGFILTNEHVVRDADEIKVSLSQDPESFLEGKVIGRDERTDLAVVKIKSSEKLPYAKLGDSASLRVGDWAIAIGSPFGLAQTVTVGIISATRQNLPIEGRNYKDLIQTDAAINPGNSGGPLVNIRGEVVGINTAIYTPSGGFAGIGFAIPIDRAKEIIPQLREKGKVVRGWIGVVLSGKIDDATANVFGVPDKKGVLIKDVLPDYPAAKAGLTRGDIIREFDGKKINDNYDLQNVVAGTPPNKTVSVSIIRNKKEMTLNLTTQEAPSSLSSLKGEEDKTAPGSSEPTIAEAQWLGATIKELHSSLKERFNIPDTQAGVIVVAVENGSKSEEIGLAAGDLVRAVNQEPVSNIKAWKEAIQKVSTTKGIVFDILRRGESLYLSYMGPEK
ncbi:MAG: Do family serine endopeptidase [Elusimicrobia bacterium]|nr:Do family serine endopeptidase [Elusimicrobiota bacterium]